MQVGDRQRIAIALQQVFAPTFAAALVEHREAARSEHEGQHALGLAQLAATQAFDRQRQHLLHQVGHGVGIAQVAQSVAARARRQQAVERRFGVARLPRRGGGDAPRERHLRAVIGQRVGGFHAASISERRAKKEL